MLSASARLIVSVSMDTFCTKSSIWLSYGNRGRVRDYRFHLASTLGVALLNDRISNPSAHAYPRTLQSA
eukprot:6186828-Pleurochrysis_carterae.AAC.2